VNAAAAQKSFIDLVGQVAPERRDSSLRLDRESVADRPLNSAF